MSAGAEGNSDSVRTVRMCDRVNTLRRSRSYAAPREIGNMLKSNSYRTTRDTGAAGCCARGSHALLAPNRGLGADPSRARARSTQHRTVIDYWRPHFSVPNSRKYACEHQHVRPAFATDILSVCSCLLGQGAGSQPLVLAMHTRVAPHSKRLGSADVENMASNIVQPFGGEDIASDIGLPSRDGSFTSRYRPQHRARSFDALKLANTWMAKSVLKRVHVLQAVANSLKSQPDPDQLTYEEKARALVEQLNVIMVAQYWLSQAFRTRKPYAVASASLWTVVACVLAIAEIVCLLSLGVAVNWPRCVTSDDCNTGQACARLFDYCLQNPSDLCPLKPTCVDCNHLAGAATGGSGEAWQNDFITGAAEYHENATGFCAEVLSAAENAHFLPGAWDDRNHRPTHANIWGSYEDETLVEAIPPSFAHCLYARQAGVSMTPTDTMILYVVFALVAMEVAAETREHANANYLRRLLLPSKPLERAAVSVCYTACRVIVTLIGFLYSKAVRVGLPGGSQRPTY